MDAVLIGELAMFVTLVQIHRIIQSVTFLIWLLDASAARRIVMGDGETNLATIIEGQRTLHQSLAEGSATNYYTTVLILDGSGNNFGGRSGKLIGEHHHLALAPSAVSLRLVFLARRSTTAVSSAASDVYKRQVQLPVRSIRRRLTEDGARVRW